MQCLKSRRSVLVHGDALRVLEELPDGSVDAVLTDPPYCSGGLTSSERRADPAAKYQTGKTVRTYPVMMRDSMDQRSWMSWCVWWLGECWRIARDGAPLASIVKRLKTLKPAQVEELLELLLDDKQIYVLQDWKSSELSRRPMRLYCIAEDRNK